MRARRLNPFATIPNAKAVWAWGMYDLANQSFQLFINTLLFGIYLAEVVVGDAERGRLTWGLMIAGANLAVVVLSPILGTIADARAWKREILLCTGIICIALMAMMPALRAGPGMLLLAVVLYGGAAIACGLGENFLASFLPELARKEDMGRISAIGWTMSYIGALLLVAVAWVIVVIGGYDKPEQWRVLFLLAAAWFGLGMLPAVFLLREKAVPQSRDGLGTLAKDALSRLGRTVREAKRFGQLTRFLGIFFVYSMGTQTVIFFAGLIGDSFGFKIAQLIVMALVMAVAAGCGAVLTGLFQDKAGHRRTVMAWLAVWVVSTLALAAMQFFQPDTRLFWFIAFGLGLGLGGIGTASRALVGAMTPQNRAAEFFGLWGMVYKAASIGGLAFGIASAALPQGVGLLLIAAFFAAGFLLMPLVDEKAGMAAAKDAESGTTPSR